MLVDAAEDRLTRTDSDFFRHFLPSLPTLSCLIEGFREQADPTNEISDDDVRPESNKLPPDQEAMEKVLEAIKATPE